MSDIKCPTPGRIVRFFPMNCVPSTNNGVISHPAMVYNEDTYPDLFVMQPSDSQPVLFIRTVSHKSNFAEGQRGYWEWPEIKP